MIKAAQPTVQTTLPKSPSAPVRCLLVSPEFPKLSFWNWESVYSLRKERAMGLPLGLLTIAGILPQHWEFRLVDMNTEPLNESDIEWADIVCIGGMVVQQEGIFDVMRWAHRLGKFVVVGGPDATSQPTVYTEADALVLGEGETNVPLWLKAWEAGSPRGTFEGGGDPDISEAPLPRYDLANLKHYLGINVQYSRGCPFNCEFCTIIELFGHKPRTKSPEQICDELDLLYAGGYRGWVDFVDDNFIGNKRDLRKMLPILAEWQKKHKYPFFFSTEASLNLCDDPELMDLMVAADFRYVFTGIESPNEEVLLGTQKPMNTHKPLVERINRMYEHGLIVMAGFILGFDDEPPTAGEEIRKAVEDTAIAISMVSLLAAIPTAQLADRLAKEGRLYDLQGNPVGPDDTFEIWMEASGEIGDQALFGLNYDTHRDRLDILRDQIMLIESLYDPENYMNRVLDTMHRLKPTQKHTNSWGEAWTDIKAFTRLAIRMTREKEIRPHFWRLLREARKISKTHFELACVLAATYLHFWDLKDGLLHSLKTRVERESQTHAPSASKSWDGASRQPSGGCCDSEAESKPAVVPVEALSSPATADQASST